MKKTAPVLALASLMMISGCVTTPQKPQNPQREEQGSAGQNAAIGAVGGALAGCALAAMLGKKCKDGAALGALIGAAIGWSSYSEKVASAQTVNEQARREGKSVPQQEIRLHDYQVQTSSHTAHAGGNPLQVVGNISLYGNARRVPEVSQSMTLFKANGQRVSDKAQIARVEQVDGAGQYRAVGTYKIPQGMEQGRYTVQCQLYLDGKVVAQRDTSFLVAQHDGKQTILALAGQ